MAPWPSGKAKVCNTSITSSNLVGASKDKKLIQEIESVFLLYTAALWRGALPAVQSKELLMKQFFLIVGARPRLAKRKLGYIE